MKRAIIFTLINTKFGWTLTFWRRPFGVKTFTTLILSIFFYSKSGNYLSFQLKFVNFVQFFSVYSFCCITCETRWHANYWAGFDRYRNLYRYVNYCGLRSVLVVDPAFLVGMIAIWIDCFTVNNKKQNWL